MADAPDLAGQAVVCGSCKQTFTMPGVANQTTFPTVRTGSVSSRLAKKGRYRREEWYENPWLVGVSVIIALLAIICFSLLTKPAMDDLDRIEHDMIQLEREMKQVTVTRKEYARIQHGMSYREVVEIIGSSGEELSSNRIDGQGAMDDIHTEMYMWQNGDGSNMNAIFQNNRLFQKSQFGLP